MTDVAETCDRRQVPSDINVPKVMAIPFNTWDRTAFLFKYRVHQSSIQKM